MDKIIALLLAAGEGKRMKSKKSKLVHDICGKALIEWVYSAVQASGIADMVVVVGQKAEQVKECLGDRVKYAFQEKQLGTGHAVMQAAGHFKGYKGKVFVLCGDTPLITGETLKKAIADHDVQGNDATVVTAILENPFGYGRIKRDVYGNVTGIVEQRDATEEEKLIKEMNSGMFIFDSEHLFSALQEINNDNDQGEYYLPDVIGIFISKGLKVGASVMEHPDQVFGINDRVQLFEASEALRKSILRKHMLAGVTIVNPEATYIGSDVEIGMDTVIYPGVHIEGCTKIGEDCQIGPDARIVASVIGDGTSICNSVVLESTIGADVHIGPFAFIRPESCIGDKVKIGDFVEIKKSKVGNRTKIPHLAYIGDSDVGENTNIACGVITVNYNGKVKSKTVIGSNSFVGCNVNLVAPVRVSDNSYIAAGSTITEEVPENALAIARSRQVNKEDWVIKKAMQRK